LVIGDFNMNPFEDGLVGAVTFHATSTRMVAARGSRVVDKKKRAFFYNPMWSILGDRRNGPPGTYYYDRGQPVSFFWNAFDQALLRPDLLEWFADDDLQVVTRIGNTSLLTAAGTPDTDVASDHLPIVISIDHKKGAPG
jgi:hypothetical protein